MHNHNIYKTPHDITLLAKQWKELHSYMEAPTSNCDWMLSAAEHLLGNTDLYLIVALENNNPIAFAPLVKSDGYFNPALQLGESHGEPGDFSYRDSTSLQVLAEALAKLRMPLSLHRIPADSPVISALQKAYHGKGLVFIRPNDGCPYIDIKGDAEQTVANLSSRLRSDLRRAARRAATKGEVSFEIHSPSTSEEFMPLWQEALQVEAASWKGESGSALVKDDRMRAFYESYAIRAAKNGTLHLCFMKINGIAVAMQIALQESDCFWLLKVGYNEAFSKCSPGMLLMEWTLRYAATQGLKSYEFLGVASGWTDRWSKKTRKNETVLVFPYTPRGMVLFTRNAFKYIWARKQDLLKQKLFKRK
ncbi:MAG: GNAT family N-acetyltransferase [uncultured Thiotrichaceae bacterium]|uniref:GNAT family N-acetyltransferase n=1 Tax=uncultured Thiotrichaceae bacterium TaxID=298394 RepID=A0A6S6SVZ5_9GAMM|nr:MAG: GNAT family N-acetyltransferase [uncultured Thiotrichaceae bacterium]